MNNIEQQLTDAFSNLPKVLQDVISSADVQQKLRNLADVHKLHLDKWNILEYEIMQALLGITDPNSLPQNISKAINIPLEKAQEITNSVVKIVFNPIQKKLREKVGEPTTIAEEVVANDVRGEFTKIDISKFSEAPTTPGAYKPKTTKKYADNNDPYHEPIE